MFFMQAIIVNDNSSSFTATYLHYWRTNVDWISLYKSYEWIISHLSR